MDWLNPMWTAKYGTVAAVPSRGTVSGAADGINEKGLTGSPSWLAECDYGKHDPERNSLSLGWRLQYYLDNLATEQAAVHFTEKADLQPVTGAFDGRRMTVHLARYNGDRVH